MKIAIIGSRTGFTKNAVAKVMFEEFGWQDNVLITGGAMGVDTFAIELAKENGHPKVEVIRPIDKTNKLNYLLRNIEIITKADRIIAFGDGNSKGTKFVIDYAKARNKDLNVITKKHTSEV